MLKLPEDMLAKQQRDICAVLDDLWARPAQPCPHCGWESCVCDLPTYQGALYSEGRH